MFSPVRHVAAPEAKYAVSDCVWLLICYLFIKSVDCILYCWAGSNGAAVHREQEQTSLFDEYQGQAQREFLSD